MVTRIHGHWLWRCHGLLHSIASTLFAKCYNLWCADSSKMSPDKRFQGLQRSSVVDHTWPNRPYDLYGSSTFQHCESSVAQCVMASIPYLDLSILKYSRVLLEGVQCLDLSPLGVWTQTCLRNATAAQTLPFRLHYVFHCADHDLCHLLSAQGVSWTRTSR